MIIPNAENAIISPEKLRDYLLSADHPVGRFKAAYFKNIGYPLENWTVLERDLREQVLTQDAVEVPEFPHGRKFVINGHLSTPLGKTVKVTSVWVILKGESVPRFVTVYPGGLSDEL